jgi:hypothetical protein
MISMDDIQYVYLHTPFLIRCVKNNQSWGCNLPQSYHDGRWQQKKEVLDHEFLGFIWGCGNNNPAY